jgi:5-oxoprolinase (ATP-hydrolysing) subunit A
MRIDLNCDMGEGMPNDAALMPYISSANIACGFHAGDENIMATTIQLCKEFGVRIGAHPSFPDRANFGRTMMTLKPLEIYGIVREQIKSLAQHAFAQGEKIHHVKPHGALYNASAKDPAIAKAIAQAVYDEDPNLVLFGLSGSCSIDAAEAMGLKIAHEVFGDRAYLADGSLVPRNQAHACFEEIDEVQNQVKRMVQKREVQAISGEIIPIHVDTICLHGDGPHALEFAKAIRELLDLLD